MKRYLRLLILFWAAYAALSISAGAVTPDGTYPLSGSAISIQTKVNAEFGVFRKGDVVSTASTNSGNDITLTSDDYASPTFVKGLNRTFVAGFTSGGLTRINLDGQGFIQLDTAAGAATVGGEIVTGNLYQIYSTATHWRLVRIVPTWNEITGKPTTLAGYGITDAQPLDAELTAIAGLTSAADQLPYFTGSGTAGLTSFPSFGRSIVGSSSASAARTTLGVAIGTNVEAWDTDLDCLAALSATGYVKRTGAGTCSAGTAITGADLASNTVGYAQFVQATANGLICNTLGASQNWQQCTAATVKTLLAISLSTDVSGTLQAAQFPALTGDVTSSAGALATTIANNAVTNAKAAQMGANSIKCNNTGSLANAIDCTVAQINTLINSTVAPVFANITSKPTTLAGYGITDAEGTFTATTGVSAAGTNQAGATAITKTSDFQLVEVTTVGSGQGVLLPASAVPARQLLVNRGANALLIYPTSTGTIDGGSASAPVTLGVNQAMVFTAKDASNNWYTLRGATYSATAPPAPGTASAGTSNDFMRSDAVQPAADLSSTTQVIGVLAASHHPALTGDVTTSSGAVATTIANAAVSLAKMANLNANSIICNNTGSGATPIACTVAQVKTLLAIVRADITDLGTGVSTALGINVGSAGSFITNGGAGGTPSSINLSNGSSLPAGTALTGQVPIANGGTAQSTAAAARGSSGLNIDQATPHGDSNYTILSTDRTVITSVTLTAARTWTLPAANALTAGQQLTVSDLFGAINGANTLTVQRAGSDTINGVTSVALPNQYNLVVLVSDGSSKWTYQAAAGGGSGTVTNATIAAGNGISVSGTCAITTSGTCTVSTPRIDANSQITPIAGTTALQGIILQSGTNLTTPAAGAVEFDGVSPYFDVAASHRGVLQATSEIRLTSTYTLTSQTAAQKLFNTSTNGAFNAAANVTYDFECWFTLTSMAGASNTFGFALGGTATFTQAWWATAIRAATLSTATSPQMSFNTAANTSLATATANGGGAASIRGRVITTVAGTVIPQVSLTAAAAAVVGVGSFCDFTPMGSNSTTVIGNFN